VLSWYLTLLFPFYRSLLIALFLLASLCVVLTRCGLWSLCLSCVLWHAIVILSLWHSCCVSLALFSCRPLLCAVPFSSLSDAHCRTFFSWRTAHIVGPASVPAPYARPAAVLCCSLDAPLFVSELLCAPVHCVVRASVVYLCLLQCSHRCVATLASLFLGSFSGPTLLVLLRWSRSHVSFGGWGVAPRSLVRVASAGTCGFLSIPPAPGRFACSWNAWANRLLRFQLRSVSCGQFSEPFLR